MRSVCLIAALMCRDARGEELLQFSLRESAAAVERRMGANPHSAAGRGYSVLEFGKDQSEHNDLGYEWIFYFEQPSGELLSVTRNMYPGRSAGALFPSAEVRTHRREGAGSQTLHAISRVLPGDRVLLAIGMGEAGAGFTQIILMRKSVVGRFYPWIAAGLK